jgi:uncharacterized protein
MTVLGTIAELWRYPVSSTGGQRLQTAELDARGIAGDRLWGIVDVGDGEVAGPEKRRRWRSVPSLSSRFRDDHAELADGQGGWLQVGSPEADARISEVLGFAAAVRPHVAFESERAGHVAPRYLRADLHILTTASTRHLAGLLGEDGAIDSRRFRPNIVIETAPGREGFAEHALVGRTLVVGDVRIVISEPCARCAFTALAQPGLGFRSDVLHAIARHGEGGFGVLCAVERTGTIALGDSVEIVEGG